MPFDALPDTSTVSPFTAKKTGVRCCAAMRWAGAPYDGAAAAAEARRRRGATSHYAGLAAEDAVARRYVGAGAAVIARRWRCEHGEIDLIMLHRETLVFIEVRYRKNDHYGGAKASITSDKQQKIHKISQYLQKYNNFIFHFN